MNDILSHLYNHLSLYRIPVEFYIWLNILWNIADKFDILFKDHKNNLSKYLKNIDYSHNIKLPFFIHSSIESLFGLKYFSLKCFYTSCLISTIYCTYLFLVWATTNTSQFLTYYNKFTFNSIIQLLSILFFLNLFSDYISFIQTRYFLHLINKTDNILKWCCFILTDFLLTLSISVLFLWIFSLNDFRIIIFTTTIFLITSFLLSFINPIYNKYKDNLTFYQAYIIINRLNVRDYIIYTFKLDTLAFILFILTVIFLDSTNILKYVLYIIFILIYLKYSQYYNLFSKEEYTIRKHDLLATVGLFYGLALSYDISYLQNIYAGIGIVFASFISFFSVKSGYISFWEPLKHRVVPVYIYKYSLYLIISFIFGLYFGAISGFGVLSFYSLLIGCIGCILYIISYCIVYTLKLSIKEILLSLLTVTLLFIPFFLTSYLLFSILNYILNILSAFAGFRQIPFNELLLNTLKLDTVVENQPTLGIFFYSTFLTSFSIWIYVTSIITIKILEKFRNQFNNILTFFGSSIDEKPFHVIAFFAALICTLFTQILFKFI